MLYMLRPDRTFMYPLCRTRGRLPAPGWACVVSLLVQYKPGLVVPGGRSFILLLVLSTVRASLRTQYNITTTAHIYMVPWDGLCIRTGFAFLFGGVISRK